MAARRKTASSGRPWSASAGSCSRSRGYVRASRACAAASSLSLGGHAAPSRQSISVLLSPSLDSLEHGGRRVGGGMHRRLDCVSTTPPPFGRRRTGIAARTARTHPPSPSATTGNAVAARRGAVCSGAASRSARCCARSRLWWSREMTRRRVIYEGLISVSSIGQLKFLV